MKMSKAEILQSLCEDFEDETQERVKIRRTKPMRKGKNSKKQDSKRRAGRIDRAFRHGDLEINE